MLVSFDANDEASDAGLEEEKDVAEAAAEEEVSVPVDN